MSIASRLLSWYLHFSPAETHNIVMAAHDISQKTPTSGGKFGPPGTTRRG
jgi:hypothetical protein